MVEAGFSEHRPERNLRVMNWIGIIIAFIGGVMTVMNIVQRKGFVTLTTLFIFFAGLVVTYSVRVLKSRAVAIFTALFVCIVVFSYYAISGVNDGFAILWIIVVPLGFNYFGGVKYAVILSLYYEILLMILFYTPLRGYMAEHYSETFMNRFPLLYLCTILINSIAMFHYHFSTLYRIENEKKLREAAAAAVAAEKAKSRFLAQMSHEIRTPINAVLGMNEMILREATDRDILDYSESIEEAGETLLALINSILDFSKIEDDKMEILPVRYETAAMVRRLVSFVYEGAKKKSLDIIVDVDETLPSVLLGDDMRVSQVITNLLSNAVKYTEKGQVVLTIRDDGRDGDTIRLFISVRDTGIGIRQEDMAKLLDPFERLEERKNRSIEGTGLGMSIVKRLLELMDSKIEVESVYGEGSTFFFRINQTVLDGTPIGKYQEHQSAEEKKSGRYLYAPAAKILVVDDNEMNCKVARNLLKLSGIVPDIAFSGMEAIALMQQKVYDIVFLDHMMPKMDGIETLHRLNRENSIPVNTVMVALTANAITGARDTYIEAGFDEYLPKPIEIRRLEALLERYLPEGMAEWREGTDRQRTAEPAAEEMRPGTPAEDVPKKEKAAPEPAAAAQEAVPERLRRLGLSVEEGLAYCGGDEDFYLELLRDLAASFPAKRQELDRYFDGEDWKQYAVAVHAMKSSFKTVGAMDLFRRAKDLEEAAKAPDIDRIRADHAAFLAGGGAFTETLSSVLGK